MTALSRRFALASTDLLRDATYRRLWTSILISSFGGQVTLLALPLTAAVLLQASPTQMGFLTAMEIVPFVLFSLPTGVWLDRVRKLPVYVIGELSVAGAVATVPIAWWLNALSISWLYVVGFVIGAVNTTAGSAAQVVLTQIVPRRATGRGARQERAGAVDRRSLGARGCGRADQAHWRAAGAARRCLPAADIGLDPARRAGEGDPEPDQHAVLACNARRVWTSCAVTRCWSLWRAASAPFSCAARPPRWCRFCSPRVQLGLSERGVGLSYVALGVGTIVASAVGHRLARRFGPGPTSGVRLRIMRCRLAAARASLR